MLPSEELRKNIEEQYGINLKPYIWPEEFKQEIFSIQFDSCLETNAKTLGEIYSYGFNIGHCGLTSRYIAIKYPKATLFYGKATLLKGTKSSPNGEHAWTVLNDFLIDSTLMIMIPLRKIQELGYSPETQIAQDSARILSEYDLYDNDFKALQQNPTLKKQTI